MSTSKDYGDDDEEEVEEEVEKEEDGALSLVQKDGAQFDIVLARLLRDKGDGAQLDVVLMFLAGLLGDKANRKMLCAINVSADVQHKSAEKRPRA